ncbi:Ctf8-domain containing protein [Nitzschia inconspicua]|uniref:Ctf8-domain containing protein n=1 Tax=Nitzschia inconspicua TaxID=303405 RepID=A0A9K3LAJ8_9STRA|nr:Ctf8-domain containing protein [Nitzschia inconspicua]KAG7358520.1 Ctf8-domain containing protein [Nitzschia inconspicua]
MTTTGPVQSSKVIPVRPYQAIEDADKAIEENETTSVCSPPEYVMIELNGELIAPVEYPLSDTCRTILGKDDAIELGKLRLDTKNKKPTITIGSHIVTGSVQPLKQPFCLMEKQYRVDDDGHLSLHSYQIKGIIKQKYLFNSYPKVITQ